MSLQANYLNERDNNYQYRHGGKENSSNKSSSSLTVAIDAPLHAMGFHFEHVSPQKVTGRLHLTQICWQVTTITIPL